MYGANVSGEARGAGSLVEVALRRARSGARDFAAGLVPFWRIARLLPGVSAPMTLAVAAGVVIGALLPLATTVAISVLIGAVPAAVAGGPESPAARTAVGALVVVGALFVASRALGPVRATLAAALGRRLDEHLRERVMRALNRPIGIAHLEDAETRDRIERALDTSGARWRAGSTVGPLADAAGAWLQSIGATLLLARFSVPLAVGWLGVWVIASHVIRVESLRVTEVLYNQAKFVRRANYLRGLVLASGAAKEVRVWGLLDWLIDRYAAESLRVLRSAWHERARGNRVQALAALSLGVGHLALLVAIGLAAVRGGITLAELAIYVGAAQAVGAIILTGRDTHALAYGTAAVAPVLELERLAAEAEARDALRGTVSPDGMPRQGIRLEGVTFHYPGGATGPFAALRASSEFAPSAGSEPALSPPKGQALSAAKGHDVLKDLDLFIPAGRSLAIVGANGAGKTTLVKLLCRFYNPTGGRITVDGVDLREIEPRAWQRRVSAIFQDFVHFALTARDNVVFGAPERMDDPSPPAGGNPGSGQAEAAVVEAARKAGALDVIEGLPRGWETILSRQYRGGAELSGGQWQRLALARALFAVSAGASVLILDEPTANLDVRAEAALYERFLDMTQGLTTILISHRFSTVRRADRIVVLEGGRVVEDGTHDELLAAGGRYAEMFALQAQRFAESAKPNEEAANVR